MPLIAKFLWICGWPNRACERRLFSNAPVDSRDCNFVVAVLIVVARNRSQKQHYRQT
jgi:hypothetical protein